MSTLIRRLPQFSLAFLLALLLAEPRPAWACSCVPPDPPPMAFAYTDAVFVGKVTQISSPAWPGIGASSADPVRIVFQVSDSWKGVTTSTVTVGTSAGSASCGYTFDLGKQYAVYAYNSNGLWTTNICTRTSETAHAAADLAYLSTLPKLALVSTSTPVPVVVYVIGAIVILAVVAGGIWLVRRFRTVAGEEG